MWAIFGRYRVGAGSPRPLRMGTGTVPLLGPGRWCRRIAHVDSGFVTFPHIIMVLNADDLKAGLEKAARKL